jgi:hypothetical protein
VAEEVNNSFKAFMGEAFHCPKTRAEVIQAGRESISEQDCLSLKKDMLC